MNDKPGVLSRKTILISGLLIIALLISIYLIYFNVICESPAFLSKNECTGIFFGCPKQKCSHEVHLGTQPEGYNYYSLNELLAGYNISRNSPPYSSQLNLVYFADNKTWALQGRISDVIPFKIHDQDTNTIIEGNYTPNISIVNNNFYSDLLIINWRNASINESCYRVDETVNQEMYNPPHDTIYIYKKGVLYGNYSKHLAINQYNEVPINVTLTTPRGIFYKDGLRDSWLYQTDDIKEIDCYKKELTTGSRYSTLKFKIKMR